MNQRNDNSASIDERAELLINRYLDGEISPEDRAELERILADNPAARDLLSEYQHNDVLAARALHQDAQPKTQHILSPHAHRRTNLRLAWAGGLVAAAAVVAFSFLPDFVGDRGQVTQFSPTHASRDANMMPSEGGLVAPQAGYRSATSPYPAYRHVDDVMQRRQNDIRREWIGIPSPTEEGVIYIIERNRTSTRITPISGDI